MRHRIYDAPAGVTDPRERLRALPRAGAARAAAARDADGAPDPGELADGSVPEDRAADGSAPEDRAAHGEAEQDRPWHGDGPIDGWHGESGGADGGWVPDTRSSLGQRLTRSGPWGELAERWVPEPLRGARIDPSRRGAIALGIVAALAAVAAVIGMWWSRPEPQPVAPIMLEQKPADDVADPAGTDAGPAIPGDAVDDDEAIPTGPILVSVTGAVGRPGLVTVPADARVADAIAAAGGAVDMDDLTGLNLAARLADGDSIVVAGPSGSVIKSDAEPAGGAPAADPALVNINTADSAGLQQLPGVGPVTAASIIAYRTDHGPFLAAEQLQEVSGIGPATMAKLQPLITW